MQKCYPDKRSTVDDRHNEPLCALVSLPKSVGYPIYNVYVSYSAYTMRNSKENSTYIMYDRYIRI